MDGGEELFNQKCSRRNPSPPKKRSTITDWHKAQGCRCSLSPHMLALASTSTRKGFDCRQLVCLCYHLLHTHTSYSCHPVLLRQHHPTGVVHLPRLPCEGPQIPTVRPAPSRLGSYLPDGLICSSNLWNKPLWEEYRQSGAEVIAETQEPCNYG